MFDEIVSIIIPVYNTEKYLKKCVESALYQTYKKLEIILIDDGSTDQSGKLCDKFAELDKRVVTIHQKNKGLSGARNRGIEIAKGTYLFFLDSDDMINMDTIEILYELLLENPETDVAVTSLKKVNRTLEGQYSDKRCGIVCTGEELLYQKHWWEACGKLYKKKLFSNMRFKNGQIYEDYYLIPRLLYGRKVSYIENGMYQYYFRIDGIMGNANCPIIHYDFAKITWENLCYTKKKYGKESLQLQIMQAMEYEHMLERIALEIYPSSAYSKNKRLLRTFQEMIRKDLFSIWKNIRLKNIQKLELTIFIFCVPLSLLLYVMTDEK